MSKQLTVRLSWVVALCLLALPVVAEGQTKGNAPNNGKTPPAPKNNQQPNKKGPTHPPEHHHPHHHDHHHHHHHHHDHHKHHQKVEHEEQLIRQDMQHLQNDLNRLRQLTR